MKIYFAEVEPGEQEFFRRHFADHDLAFVRTIQDISDDAEILSTFIYSRINRDFLDAHPRLQMVSTRSTTTEHIDLSACDERNVVVCNVPHYGDYTVAEHAVMLLLAVARRLREVMNVTSRSTFSYEAIRGLELREKTLGVIGTGRIGLHTVAMAKGLKMDVIGYDVQPNHDAARELGFQYVPLDELLREAHFITLHLNLTPETFHLLNRQTLAKCRRGVVIVNTARGGLIDTEALIEAIDQEIVAGVGVDVLEEERVMRREATEIISDEIIDRIRSGGEELRIQDCDRVKSLQSLMRNAELLGRPNVIFTPHAAFNTEEAVTRLNRLAIENIKALLSGSPQNVVAGKRP
jgi:D-lactate dehydrogenase